MWWRQGIADSGQGGDAGGTRPLGITLTLRPDVKGLPMFCPVCRGISAHAFPDPALGQYARCPDCEATFLDPAHHPDADAEYAQYLHHDNRPDDPRYRAFLSRLSVPLLARLASGLDGLDYGCGPGPALAQMMQEAGQRMALYDPFFEPDTTVLTHRYDFVTCTEVAEHFHAPADEFDRLDAMLRPGAWLGVMTCFQTDDCLFANWHYRKDPTHVVFYRPRTFEVIAQQRGWTFECPAKDVALMRKGERG